jgi:hypothetical protein
MSSLRFKQGFDLVGTKAGEAIPVFNHNGSNAHIGKQLI